jgi:hypothetical protein
VNAHRTLVEQRVLAGLFDFVARIEPEDVDVVDGWARPRDIEVYCSHVLMRLVARGAAAVKQRGSGGPGFTGRYDRTGLRRGARLFRITIAGATEVVDRREEGRRSGGSGSVSLFTELDRSSIFGAVRSAPCRPRGRRSMTKPPMLSASESCFHAASRRCH